MDRAGSFRHGVLRALAGGLGKEGNIAVRWRKTFIAEVAGKLQQLGVKACPVCGSESLGVDPLPVVILRGGLPPTASNISRDEDPYRQVDYLVRVECELCGSSLMFNSEKYSTSGEKTLAGPGAENE